MIKCFTICFLLKTSYMSWYLLCESIEPIISIYYSTAPQWYVYYYLFVFCHIDLTIKID